MDGERPGKKLSAEKSFSVAVAAVVGGGGGVVEMFFSDRFWAGSWLCVAALSLATLSLDALSLVGIGGHGGVVVVVVSLPALVASGVGRLRRARMFAWKERARND